MSFLQCFEALEGCQKERPTCKKTATNRHKFSSGIIGGRGVEGLVWYRGWEVPPDASFGFHLREACQSNPNTKKILYNKSS